MTKRNWLLFILVLSSLFVSQKITNGCGGDWDLDELRVVLFKPTLLKADAYRPFFYSKKYLYDWGDNKIDSGPDNIEDWQQQTDSEIDKKDISDIVYNCEIVELNKVITHLKKGTKLKLSNELNNNRFLFHLIKKKDIETLDYLVFAKRCEPHVKQFDYWETPERNEIEMQKLSLEAEKKIPLLKNKNIKLRYAYQAQRLAHYTNKFKDCLRIYEKHIAPMANETYVSYAALSLKAGALKRTGKINEANFIFSLLFDKCTSLRVLAFQNYVALNAIETNKTTMLCIDDHQKATIHTLNALKTTAFNIDELKHVVKIEPKSSFAEILLIREINKIEDEILLPKNSAKIEYRSYKGYSNLIAEEPTKEELNYLAELKVYVLGIAESKNTQNPTLWYLSASYLAILQNNLSEAEDLLKSAEKLNALNDRLEAQLYLQKILIQLNGATSVSEKLEDELVDNLIWLQDYARKKDNNFESCYQEVMMMLAKKYMAKDDFTKSIICLEKSGKGNYLADELLDVDANQKEIDKIIELIKKPKKTAFEIFITSKISYDQNYFNHLQGTKYLRVHDFVKAAEKFNLLPDDFFTKEPYTTYLAANPFADLLFDTHAPTKQDTITYNKLTFAKRMVELEKLAKSDKKNAAQHYYTLANGFYNMTYYGNSWLLVHDYWGSTGWSYSDKLASSGDDYYDCKKAEEYYLKAQKASKDNEFKARCEFMAAKCEQKRLNIFVGQNKMKESKHFLNLKKNFAPTQFYETAIKECYYFNEFVASAP